MDRCFVNLLLTAAFFFAPLSYAQPTPEQMVQAQKSFDDAEAHYKLQEWQKALDGYKESYFLSREPAILFNIAQCYRQLQKYDEALKSYRNFIREVPDSPYRADAETLIKRCEDLQQAAASQPTTEPGSEPTTGPSSQVSSASSPATKPVEPPSLTAKALYGASLGSFALGGLFGALGLSSGVGAQRLFLVSDGSIDEIEGAVQKARVRGFLSDGMLLASLAATSAAYVVRPSPYLSRALYGVAGLGAVASLGTGLFALSSISNAKALSQEAIPDVNEILFQKARADLLGRSSNILLGAALVTGGAGFVLHQRTHATLSPTFRGMALSVRF